MIGKVTCATAVFAALLAYTSGAGPATRRPPPADMIFQIARLNMTLVRIEPGEFVMGSPADEAERHENELQHKVRLTKPFYIQATEVSQAQYKAVMGGENPSHFKGDDLPVERVSWHAAALFCELLRKREGRTFRLPTEAEWEYAARAGKDGPVSGSGKLAEMAWHADNSGKQPLDSATIWDTDQDNYFDRLNANDCRTRIVGGGTANAWGLHDMQGNVSEWVGDWYAKDYYAASPAADPPGPATSPLESRVIRGGAWSSDPRHCRIGYRDWNDPAKCSASRGFRVVMEAE